METHFNLGSLNCIEKYKNYEIPIALIRLQLTGYSVNWYKAAVN